MKYISSHSGIILGQIGHKVFSHDLTLLRERRYQLVGKLVAWSIIHGGPGLACLSNRVFCLMLHSDADINAEDVELVSDREAQDNLKKVRFP